MKLKIDIWTPKQSPTNMVCSWVGGNCLLVFQKQFSFSYPFFKPLKMPFKFTFSLTLIKINSCHIYYVGGAVASWLVRPTPERVVRVWGLAADIVLCYWARHFTLTVPLSTQVYKWVPANLMLGVTLRWTGIPSRGE